MAKNANLASAKASKKDEFYTQLADIEKELCHYTRHFAGKTVLCNCDDPRVSNFFHYFAYRFEQLKLARLITTCYKSQELNLFSRGDSERAIYLEYTGEKSGGRVPTVEQIGLHPLKGDGDFRSSECIALLEQADIVVTNPPFSLFREYVAQLVEHGKRFLIIGNQNAITYKEIFPLIKENRLWLGVNNGAKEYIKPDGTRQKMGNTGWFTNLEHNHRHEPLILTGSYPPQEYPRYDNYNAIEVSKTADIPADYDGVMGVPITFLDKYCPEQFEIIWQASGNTRASAPKKILEQLRYTQHPEDRGGCPVINGVRQYSRLFIRRRR